MRGQLKTLATTDPKSGSADAITLMLVPITPCFDFAPRRAVLDEMISSGGLQLIRSDTLRRMLAVYQQALVLDHSKQNDMITFFRTQMSPYILAHGSLPSTARLSERVDQDINPGDVDFPFQADVEAFYGNRTYANLLMAWMLMEGQVRSRQREVLHSIDALLGFLADPAIRAATND